MGTPIRLSADFSTETLQARREWHNVFKVINSQEYSTQQDSHSDLMEKSRAFQTSKVKRIQHHQTSFTTYAKGASLGRKHKRRKRPTENKAKTFKKSVGSYISVNILNVNGLNTPTKRHRLAGRMKTCACMHFHSPHHSI